MSCFRKFFGGGRGGFDLPGLDSVMGKNYVPYHEERTRFESFGGQTSSRPSNDTIEPVSRSSKQILDRTESGVGSMVESQHDYRLNPGPPPKRSPPPLPVEALPRESLVEMEDGTALSSVNSHNSSLISSLSSSCEKLANTSVPLTQSNELNEIENTDDQHSASRSTHLENNQYESANVGRVSKLSDETIHINNIKTSGLDDTATDLKANSTHNELQINSNGENSKETITKLQKVESDSPVIEEVHIYEKLPVESSALMMNGTGVRPEISLSGNDQARTVELHPAQPQAKMSNGTVLSESLEEAGMTTQEQQSLSNSPNQKENTSLTATVNGVSIISADDVAPPAHIVPAPRSIRANVESANDSSKAMNGGANHIAERTDDTITSNQMQVESHVNGIDGSHQKVQPSRKSTNLRLPEIALLSTAEHLLSNPTSTAHMNGNSTKHVSAVKMKESVQEIEEEDQLPEPKSSVRFQKNPSVNNKKVSTNSKSSQSDEDNPKTNRDTSVASQRAPSLNNDSIRESRMSQQSWSAEPRMSHPDKSVSGTESESDEPTTPDKIDELNKLDDASELKNKHARKRGIISDKIDQKDSSDFIIVTYPKDIDSQALIRNAITANDFLNNMMDAERLTAVMEAMVPRVYEANSYIIQEGEIGSHFYVSAQGTFEVLKDSKSVIKSFGSGVVFGELAILYKARRFASIRVTEASKVWMLERKVFQKIMMRSGKRERDQNIKFLSSVSVLKDLPASVLSQISDLLKREFYPAGATIIQQGDPGDKFYIIRGGSVNILKTDNKIRDRVVGTLHRGAYFGEQALLHEDKRLASIIANPPGTECLTLDRIAFNNYLGGLEKIINTKIVDNPPPVLTGSHVSSEYDHVQIHDLTFVGTLGIGGFGRVELVQLNKQQTFALKYLKKNEMVKQQQQEHAYSEKDIMLSCDSPFIVRLYKTFRDQKYLYFLMEACLGGDVWTILQQKKFFDERTARFMTACVIEAFEYLHTRNMIYRDLKPENLMLDSKGYIKLVDFGFAKRMGLGQKTWTFAGTPEYVAPEIILNKGHDRAADYWALGVFIHELLVGKPPFRGKDHMKTYNLILRGIDVLQMPAKIPRKAQVLIKRLCRQNATERLGYQKNGIADIKNHQWFVGFDWNKLQDRTMPAPLMRPVKGMTDLSNFDQYQEDRDVPPDENSGWDSNF